MKKVMFVLVCLLIVSTFAFALESGPSNKVGYVKIQCNANGYTSFGLPFKFWYVPAGNIPTYGQESRKPSSIVGSQANCGSLTGADRVVRQDNGEFALRQTPNCNWTQALETNPADMEPGRAYWYKNNTSSVRNLVLAGEADTTAVGIPSVTIGAPGSPGGIQSTPYSWRDPRDVATNHLNLLAQGFTGGGLTTSDKVLHQISGAFAWYNTSNSTWQGFATITPGIAYWIQNKHSGHTWTYTYNASGAQLAMPGGPASIQKVSAPAVITRRTMTGSAKN